MENARDLLAFLAAYSSETRLYELTFKDGNLDLGSGGLLVEAFLSIEELQTIGARDIIVLSSNGKLALGTLLGQQASLQISLADGSRANFTGLVNQAAMLGSSAGLVRFRIRLGSFLWPLTNARPACLGKQDHRRDRRIRAGPLPFAGRLALER